MLERRRRSSVGARVFADAADGEAGGVKYQVVKKDMKGFMVVMSNYGIDDRVEVSKWFEAVFGPHLDDGTPIVLVPPLLQDDHLYDWWSHLRARKLLPGRSLLRSAIQKRRTHTV